jgi:hypothetical protein
MRRGAARVQPSYNRGFPMIEQRECERNLDLLERRNEELRALVEIGKALTSTLDLRVIMEKVSLLLKPHSWSLLLVEEASGDLPLLRHRLAEALDGEGEDSPSQE